MMISPAGASDPYAAATALDRQLRFPGADAADAPSDGAAAESPDVVVTLSQGSSPPATYGASGRLAGAPTLGDLGANQAGSMARASEAVAADADADAGPSDATAGSDAVPAAQPEAADAPA